MTLEPACEAATKIAIGCELILLVAEGPVTTRWGDVSQHDKAFRSMIDQRLRAWLVQFRATHD
jgi:hypothetical protein